jgi:hypothetical protein
MRRLAAFAGVFLALLLPASAFPAQSSGRR